MKSPARGFTAPAVLMAAAFGLSLNGPHRANAAPTAPIAQNDSSVAVTILSPVPHQSFGGIKPVEISAFYQGSAGNQVVNIELFVDGNKAAQKVLDAPETRGVVSFLIDASALTGGSHRIVVRATAADAEIASAHSSFVYETPAPQPVTVPESMAPSQPAPLQSAGAPTLSIIPPRGAEDGQVQGTVKLRVRATDPSGKAPYVSLFIDRQFKTLRNYAPYEFEWDTTAYTNGYHTIEAFGYNDAQAVGHAQSVRLFVNNPGGRTERRTDLLDVTPTKSARPAARSLPTGRKASAVARRPEPSAVSPAKAATTETRHRLRMTQVFALIQRSARLSAISSLPTPFVGDAVLPAAASSKATVAVVKPHPTLPSHGYKPMVRSITASSGGAMMALTQSTQETISRIPRLMRLSKIAPSGTELSSEFMLSPTMPRIKATVASHTTLSATPTTTRVLMHHSQSAQTIKVRTPRTVRDLKIHLPRMSSQINWLRAVGQKTLLFNSSRLPLDRPLTAQGSVMFGPLRQIFQQEGGTLIWQARTGVVHGRTRGKDVLLTIGKKTAVINDAIVMLEGKPYLNSGRTMIPLSFLQQAMNVDVQYDQASGHLMITSKN